MDKLNISIIKNVIKKFDMRGYGQCVGILNKTPLYNPWPLHSLAKNKLVLMENRFKYVLLFFYLGIPLPGERLAPFLSPEEIEALCGLDLLKIDDGQLIPRKILISFQGIYLFVDAPYFYPAAERGDTPVYLGMDSFLLSHDLPKQRVNKALDLCCGSGIHAILLSYCAQSVTGAEITHEALRIAELNAAINDRLVSFYRSDLFSGLKGSFDFIVTKPPNQSIPNKVKNYPAIGNGGQDGLKIFRRILSEADNHLNHGGNLITLLQLFGDDNKIYFLDELTGYLEKFGWTALVIKRDRQSAIDQERYLKEQLTRTSNETPDGTNWFEGENHYLYNCFIRIIKNGVPGMDVISLPHIKDQDTFCSNSKISAHDLNQSRIIKILGRQADFMEKEILKQCNGTDSVGNIKQYLRKSEGAKGAENHETKIDQAFQTLQNYGVIIKKT